MGIFTKKDKIYPLTKAMELLKMKKYEHYTTLPVGNGFKLVPQEEANKHIGEYKKGITNRLDARNSFTQQISGNGIYRKQKPVNIIKQNEYPNYNNWQSAKRYNEEDWVK